jgi:hypothetical protein
MSDEFLYPQGTPASAVDYEDEMDPIPIRLRAPFKAEPYSAMALMSCPLCLARLGPDWPLVGYSLDLAVLTHVSHRLAEVHSGPEALAIA